ncbi:MAG: RNA polymerase sigma factor [Terriglobia bacterium]
MAIDSDLELMLRVKDGSAESFELLLKKYRLPLVGYLVRMVGDPTLAEDLAQEVFLRVYQARERYRPDARFTTWLYRIATNLALNSIRKRKSEPAGVTEGADEPPAVVRVADKRPGIEEQLMLSDREQLIREAVQSLPENQRAAVILHKYQDVDYRHIAKVLHVSESAVKSLLFRAYENLRTQLEPLLQGGRL